MNENYIINEYKNAKRGTYHGMKDEVSEVMMLIKKLQKSSLKLL